MNRKVIDYLLVVTLLLPLISFLSGSTLSSEGFGECETSARNSALANLSQHLFVQVESKISVAEGEIDDQVFSRIVREINTTSNLPLLGAKFLPVIKEHKDYKVTVLIDPEDAIPLYEDRLQGLHNNLEAALQYLTSSHDPSFRYDRLLKAKSDLEEFEVNRFIYLALNGKKKFNPPISEEQISLALHKLTDNFEDLTFALEHHQEKFLPYERVYVNYPSVYPSNEVTQLSRVIRENLSSRLNAIDNAQEANYLLRSSYEILEDSITLSLRLVGRSGNIEQAEIIRLSQKAYQSYDYVPKTIDLAKQIEMGELISNKLNIQLTGLNGSNQLFYTKGEKVNLKVKSNLPVDYYIVAHTYTDEEVYSYLLELSPTFIGRISADHTNRWVELVEFEVVEPFGVETLQIFAATGSLLNSLPPVKRDEIYDLYKISDNPNTAVRITRGLRPVSREVETSEATLTITTMER